ncbi:hypothetical protein [Dongia deserti]|uniref:hypothetical protein n=1 Tax=Dongia deserti TaxID=2268030 RepID=UPI000E6535BF|nr:hypothetical protein [Dongia deserti]
MSSSTNWSLLRLALLADAIASGAMGVLLAAAAAPLADWLGLPLVLLRLVGLILIPYAGLLAYLGTRQATSRLPAQLIVAGNVLWVAGSILLLVTDLFSPTTLGMAFVIAQALVVAILAEAQFIGLRRQHRLAAG